MADKANKEHQMLTRMSEEMYDKLEAAVKQHNLIAGNFEEQSVASVVRELCSDFIKRIEAITESEVAQHAANVLRKGRRGARRAG